DPCVPPEPFGPAFEVVASAESHSIKLYPPGVSIPGIDMTSQVPGSRILLNGTELSPGGLCEVRWETDSELGKSYVHLAADSLTEVKLINGDLIGSPAILIRSAPETGGQIGINTDSPAEALEVVGNAHIEGNLTWQAKTSYVAISAAAFGPYQSGIEYLNFGQSLEKTGGGASVFFHAHVQLPQGAEVDRMTCYWEDGTIDNGQFTLYRSHLIDGSADVMGLAETSGESGNGSSYDDSIEYSPVDNSQYAYFMRARLYSDMALYGIVVEYRFTEPY
ncbi:MAG: hypothetical protein OEW00_10150, partial [candidate division Zixibacteria bacterium]|nr:hypothetical protein [candidate division Zixibacteria bacterium]